MFIGHFGVAFAAKRIAPTVSLGTLFLASQLADLVWPNLVPLGIERVEVEPGATAVGLWSLVLVLRGYWVDAHHGPR